MKHDTSRLLVRAAVPVVVSFLFACTPSTPENSADEEAIPPNPPVPPPAVEVTPATLPGEWIFESLETGDSMLRAPLGDPPPTIDFTQEPDPSDSTQMRLAGSGGCNRIMGTYHEMGLGEIMISQLASTQMACPEPLMSLEAELLGKLSQVRSYQINGAELVLQFPGGTARYLK